MEKKFKKWWKLEIFKFRLEVFFSILQTFHFCILIKNHAIKVLMSNPQKAIYVGKINLCQMAKKSHFLSTVLSPGSVLTTFINFKNCADIKDTERFTDLGKLNFLMLIRF